MKPNNKFLIFNSLLLVALFSCFGLSGQGLQDSLKHDDDNIVSSIAPYPVDVRDAILDVSQYPQKLVKIGRLQARTSQSFQDLVEKYPRDVQEKLYDMSRYPNLVNQLVSGDSKKSPEQIKTILSAYPAEIATSANDLYAANFSDLKSMNKSYQESEEALHGVLKSLPDQTQADFKKVIGMPDVMTLLTDRIDLTVSLGEAYKSNPEDVRQNLTNLNSQITEQNAKDLDSYKKEVANDPKLQDEMKKSSADFANSYSETDDGTQPVVNNYYNTATPYPYWFGYPYWYPSPVWYPRPLYYHTGFYMGAGGMVVVGLPSYAYSNWFFGYGYRSYPRMYGRYNAYYNYHYRPNYNVYRGYNTAVREHFNRVNNISPSTNRGGGGMTRYSQSGNTNPNIGGRTNSAGGRTQAPSTVNRSQQNFRNSINSNNFNSQRFNNFQSNQFHQQNWHSMGSGGMQRSNMGGGAVRGGFSGGGGAGGNRGGGGARRGR